MRQIWFFRVLAAVLSAHLDIAARLPGGRYVRFTRLPYWSKQAVDRGSNERASQFARELLTLAHARMSTLAIGTMGMRFTTGTSFLGASHWRLAISNGLDPNSLRPAEHRDHRNSIRSVQICG